MENKDKSTKKQKILKVIHITLRVLLLIFACVIIIYACVYSVGFCRGYNSGSTAAAEEVTPVAEDPEPIGYLVKGTTNAPTTYDWDVWQSLSIGESFSSFTGLTLVTSSYTDVYPVVPFSGTLSYPSSSISAVFYYIMYDEADQYIYSIYSTAAVSGISYDFDFVTISLLSVVSARYQWDDVYFSPTQKTQANTWAQIIGSEVTPLYDTVPSTEDPGPSKPEVPPQIDTTGKVWWELSLLGPSGAATTQLVPDTLNQRNYNYTWVWNNALKITYTLQYRSISSIYLYILNYELIGFDITSGSQPVEITATLGDFFNSQYFLRSLFNGVKQDYNLNQILMNSDNIDAGFLINTLPTRQGVDLSSNSIDTININPPSTALTPVLLSPGTINVEGVTISSSEVYNLGYSTGYTTGVTDGHNEGYDDGYEVGYTSGYQAGFQSNGSAFDFGWIEDFGNGFFNIRFGNLTMGTIIIVMLSLSVFGAVLKFFLGG